MKKDYLLMAQRFARMSPCLKVKYGCVMVKDNEIISFGFNEPILVEDYCKICKRKYKPHGEEYTSDCPTLHAEEWAIINAIKIGRAKELKGATAYISGFNMPKDAKPCWHCSRLMKAVGIKEVKIK